MPPKTAGQVFRVIISATAPKATFTIWRKFFIFIVAGNIGLLVAIWFLSFIVSDKCLDQGGRVGRTWAECEFQAGQIASWSDYVGVIPVVTSTLIWIVFWVVSNRLINKLIRSGA